jgi:hypothetical protein
MKIIEDEAKMVKEEIEKRGYKLTPSGRGRFWYMKEVEWQNKKGYYEVVVTEDGNIPRIFNNPVLASVMEFRSNAVMITKEYESLQAFLDGAEGKVIYQEVEGGVSKVSA